MSVNQYQAGLLGLLLIVGCGNSAGNGDDTSGPPDPACWDLGNIDPGPEDVGEEPDMSVDKGVAVADDGGTEAEAETTTQPADNSCKPCEEKSECGEGYFCTSVMNAKHCLKQCAADGDCKSGYICYQASSEGLQCLPVSYNCVGCAYDGCQDDKCCDMQTGHCHDCMSACGNCTYDYQCPKDHRCYKKTGHPTGNCVAECGDTGTCAQPDEYVCDDNGKGVMLCIPVYDQICSGCPDEKPYALPDGTCVECLNSTHCAETKPFCHPGNYTCGGSSECGVGSFKCDDGQCHQCCEDADCDGLGGSGKCLDYVCEGHYDSCENTCAPPYPACANVGGVWQCVQCDSDDDCYFGGCVCDKELFVCDCGPIPCWSPCASVDDCPPGSQGQTLDCHLSGVCYDPSGHCDGITSCCGIDQFCMDLVSILLGGWAPFLIEELALQGYCSCNNHDDCVAQLPCTEMDVFCSIPIYQDFVCSQGQLAKVLPEKMCFDPAEFQEVQCDLYCDDSALFCLNVQGIVHCFGCMDHSQCDDANPCTTDTCEPCLPEECKPSGFRCQHESIPDCPEAP